MTTIEMCEWSFPDVEHISEPLEVDMSAYLMPAHQDVSNALNLDKNDCNDTGINDEIMNKKRLIEEELDEVKKLRNTYENNISTVEGILSKLKNPASIIDEELMDLMQDIIKKMVKKITLSAIDSDPNLLKKMIAEMKSAIDSKDGMVSVYISPCDYQKILSNSSELSILATTDDTLSEGDIIVKSNFSEVRAIMNERIDQLIRINHD